MPDPHVPMVVSSREREREDYTTMVVAMVGLPRKLLTWRVRQVHHTDGQKPRQPQGCALLPVVRQVLRHCA